MSPRCPLFRVCVSYSETGGFQATLGQGTVRRFPGFAQGYAGGKRVKFKVRSRVTVM